MKLTIPALCLAVAIRLSAAPPAFIDAERELAARGDQFNPGAGGRAARRRPVRRVSRPRPRRH